jgi:hypothetical protein
VAWNGTDVVVAWNDLRNGNQDIYAARVRPDRTVRDPNGFAVTTAAGIQRRPSIASAGGPTLITWISDAGAQRRVLRANGTFLGGIVTEGGAWSGNFGQVVAAASPERLGVVFEPEESRDGRWEVVFAAVDPATGAKEGRTPLYALDGPTSWQSSHIAWDGTRFVQRTSYFREESVSRGAQLGTLTGTTAVADEIDFRYDGGISSLPDGRSLLLGTRQGTLLVAAVADAP